MLTSHEEKEKNIHLFYSNLLGESLDREVTVRLEELNIPHLDLAELEVPFTEEEIWKTICSLPSNKAPGPDGFTGNFYKACWSVIKVDVMAAVSAVWGRKFGNFNLLNAFGISLLFQRMWIPLMSKISDRLVWFTPSLNLLQSSWQIGWLADLTIWSPPTKVHLLKVGLYRIISCLYSKQLDTSISRSKLECC